LLRFAATFGDGCCSNLARSHADENAVVLDRRAQCALVPRCAGSLKTYRRVGQGSRLRRKSRVKALVLVALLLAGGGPAYAQDALSRAKTAGGGHAKPVAAPQAPPQNPRAAAASLPATVPEQFSPPQEAYASFAQAGGAAPAKPSACQLRLAKVATFKPIPVLIGAGECGAMDAVMLDGVVLADGAKIVLAPAATLRCTMAEEVAAWLRDDIAPAVLKLGAPLRGLDNFDSYECRGRNRVRGATLSEHGRANALDVRGFKLDNGETVELTDVKVAKAWRDGIRSSACERFSTVLGPGSDGHHDEHIHVDLAERRGGYKMCQWDVREPGALADKSERPAETAASVPAVSPLSEPVPLPRPRPLAANTARDVQLPGKARAQ
jgi:hypothetical protein